MFNLNNIYSRYLRVGIIQRQSILSFSLQIILTFVGFFGTMYFARVVGADILGIYFLFITYFGIISIIADGGFEGAANKRISEGVEQDEYFTAFFVIRTSFIVFSIIILLIFRNYFENLNNSGTFFLLIIVLIISILYGTVSSGIIGRGKIGISSTASFVHNIFQAVFQIVAIYLGYMLFGLICGLIIGMFIAFLLQYHFLDLHFVRFSWKHIKSLASFSFWGFLISSGTLIFIYSDTLIIAHYMNNGDVGIYRVILQFSSIMLFTTHALCTALFTKVSWWDKNNKKEIIENTFSKAVTYSLILTLPILIVGVIFGDKLLYFFYGSKFEDYTTLLILFFVQMTSVFYILIKTYLSAINHIKSIFKITLLAALINIILNLILIPIIGISGAALSTLVTMLISVIVGKNILKQKILINIEYKSIFNIIKSTILIGIIMIIYRINIQLNNVWLVLIPIILCGILYIILILEFDKNIYDELKNIVNT